jgi:NADH:ubiquinone reductase (H+-translocating)
MPIKMVPENYISNIPATTYKRLVIVGGGFAGLKLALSLYHEKFQIVLIDKNNYHLFQPLLYQVAMSGLEPSAISFPIRKVFQNTNVQYRMTELLAIIPENNEIRTTIGLLKFDFLVLATGAKTNFYGQEKIEKFTLQMKSAPDALFIRNKILENFEVASTKTDEAEIQSYLNVAIIGGGPTGVELAGAMAEMKKYVLPKDYPELNIDSMKIMLFEASSSLLAGMSATAAAGAGEFLDKLGVDVHINTPVLDYDGHTLKLSGGINVEVATVIWAAGITSSRLEGLTDNSYGKNNRMLVNPYNQVQGYANVFAIGDNSLMLSVSNPIGHPQVAQVAIQQARLLSVNLRRILKNKPLKEFHYINKGTMATIGRHRAVADLPFIHLKGFIAWILWSVVHLISIVGVKNKLIIFLDWSWKYITYDQALRLLIRHKAKN